MAIQYLPVLLISYVVVWAKKISTPFLPRASTKKGLEGRMTLPSGGVDLEIVLTGNPKVPVSNPSKAKIIFSHPSVHTFTSYEVRRERHVVRIPRKSVGPFSPVGLQV